VILNPDPHQDPGKHIPVCPTKKKKKFRNSFSEVLDFFNEGFVIKEKISVLEETYCNF
jgi:hypothetical protein